MPGKSNDTRGSGLAMIAASMTIACFAMLKRLSVGFRDIGAELQLA